MAGANLPVTILVLGGGIVMVWTGITDPEKGIVGEIGRVLRGEKKPEKKKTATGADLASAILAYVPDESGATGSDGIAQVGTGSGSVVSVANSAMGIKYVWGGGNGSGPTNGGFDCSGLLQFSYKKGAGIDIPRTSETQRIASTRISESQAVPGDSVFFGMPAYHCGIYTGNGMMTHAPHTGAVVRSERVTNVKPGPITYGRFRPKTASI